MADKYDMPILYSCHPRSKKKLEQTNFQLDKRVIIHEPLGFIDYKVVKEMDKVSGGFKTVYILLSVDNYIDWTGGN